MKTLIALAVLAAFSSSIYAQSADAKIPETGTEHLTLDESWALMAAQYPGFAGYFEDGEQLVVQVADVQARAYGTRIDSLLRTISETRQPRSMRTQNVKFGFD